MIYPENYVAPEATGPLELTPAKKAEMVTWAVAAIVKPTEESELADMIEQEYVAKGEHYTSDQLKEIVEADIVAGCQSMAMVIGLLAQKKVFSCIPPGGPCCCLPQKQIVQLRDLVVVSKSAAD